MATVQSAEFSVVTVQLGSSDALATGTGIADCADVVVGALTGGGSILTALGRVGIVGRTGVLVVANNGLTGLALSIDAKVPNGSRIAVVAGGDVVLLEATVNSIAEVVGTEITIVTALRVPTAADEVLAGVADGAGVVVVAWVAVGLGGLAFPGKGVAGGVIARVIVAISTLHICGCAEPLHAGATDGAGVAVVAAGPVNGLVVAFPLLPVNGAEVDSAVIVVIAIEVDPGGVAAVVGVPVVAGIEVSAVSVVLVKTLPFRGPAPLIRSLLLDETAALVRVTPDPRQKAIKGGLAKLFEALLLALL
jgi:hypothetical protein